MGTKTKAAPKEKPLTSKELDAIIRLCSQQGVTELNFGDLHISFAPKLQKETSSKIPSNATADVEISESKHKELTKEQLEREELRAKDERLAFSFIEDPLAAERMLEEGELQDDDDYVNDGRDGESTSV